MTLIVNVETPLDRPAERAYVLGVIFDEFLGIAWRHVPTARHDVRIYIDGAQGAVHLPDILLAMPDALWRSPGSLPEMPLAIWDSAVLDAGLGLISTLLPSLYARAEPMTHTDTDISLPLDIFGSVFFMLTRYEEVAAPAADSHDRFPARASLACKAGFLDRPIVDEYVEILWAAMQKLWPGLVRTHRIGATKVSCDVDAPFDPSIRSAGVLARIAASDVLKRHDPKLAAARIARYRDYRRGEHQRDPFHTFDWYLATCERAGLNAAFYFIPAQSDKVMDAVYEIFDPKIIALMAKLHDAGHEIGTHGSYRTYRDPRQMALERDRLIAATQRTGREIALKGNRQHYLRWDTAQTPDHLEASGYQYDTTGSFADMPGFRYGTAKPFTMWSWTHGRALALQQRPLVVMECSVIDAPYLALGYTEASLALINTLKARALHFGGDFTLLWHNSHFMHPQDREWFSAVLGAG